MTEKTGPFALFYYKLLCCKGVPVIVNNIILLLIVAVITTKRGGIIKKGGRGGWEYLGPKILLTSIIFEIFHHIIISFCFFFPFSFPFLALPGNESHRFPFPKCGNGFFNSLPIPEFAISQMGIKTGIGLL